MDKLSLKPRILNAYILAGALIDLSPLDFSAVNITCYNLKSRKLKTISDKYKPVIEDYYSLYNIILKDAEKIVDGLKYIHVLLPSDFDKNVAEADYSRCINLIKLLYPSDVEYHTIAEFQLLENNEIEWLTSTSYHFYPSGADRYENFLAYPIKNEISAANELIKFYFDRIGNLKYVQLALDAYINSFLNIPSHMAFVSLCMALEVVVDGKNELMFRIKRTVALLCADNSHHAGIVFENVKLIYELRSSIVHGDTIKYKAVNEYLPYLQSLVSRMIIQLIKYNCSTSKNLQEKLLFVGYTERGALMPKDKNLVNLSTLANTYKSLKK